MYICNSKADRKQLWHEESHNMNQPFPQSYLMFIEQRMGEWRMLSEVCMEWDVRLFIGLLQQCLLSPLLSISVILPALFWIHSSTTCAKQAQPDSWAALLSWYRPALVQETRSAGATFYSHIHLYICSHMQSLYIYFAINITH